MKICSLTDSQLAEALVTAVAEAGRAILEVRRRGYRAEQKADASPVTEADHAAERIVLERLAALAPDIPVIAEEATAAGHLPEVSGSFFLVDALDGTKEFVKGGDDFTVNVALVRDGIPVMGVVHTPAIGEMFVGVAGEGAWVARAENGTLSERQVIRVRPAPGAIDVVASRSHRTPETDAYIARYAVRSMVPAGSSLKFCCLAEGKADLYPRMGSSMQWDTAAGDAVLRAAGGRTVTLGGVPLRYGPNGAAGAAGYQNPWFVAVGTVHLVS